VAALWFGVALVIVVIIIGVLLPAGPLGVDRSWSEWMRDTQTHALHQLALVLNRLGRGVGRALSLAAIGVALAMARRWWALAAFAAAENLTPLASNLAKHLVARPRPEQDLLHVAGSSFPSGHAAYAGTTCVALVLLYARSSRRPRIWWWAVAGSLSPGWRGAAPTWRCIG
jgi:membrane-associated phospholipid phosphatase